MRVLLGLLFATAALAQSYEARHEHLRGECKGKLTIDEQSVAYETEKKGHSWRLSWVDVQQIQVLETGEVRVVSYQDRKWRLGADREYRMIVGEKKFAAEVSPGLERRLGRRFVSGVAREVKPLWEIRAKHLRRILGVEGTLVAAEDRIQFRAERPGESREWMFSDIDNISTSDPYQLTITTFERARGHYGDRKGFNFRLKEPLEAERYNRLWRRLEASKGLQLADERSYGR
jgi:hypothetical protein